MERYVCAYVKIARSKDEYQICGIFFCETFAIQQIVLWNVVRRDAYHRASKEFGRGAALQVGRRTNTKVTRIMTCFARILWKAK